MTNTVIGGNQYVKNISLKASQICDKTLKGLLFKDNKTKLVLGYISPHLDFEEISKKIKSFFKDDIKVLLSSTAGELCNIQLSKQKSIYLKTGDSWDTIVLQSFSSDLIKNISIHTVSLHNEDIKKGKIKKGTARRVSLIENEIKKIDIDTQIDYKKYFVFALADGVSNSESFLIEAIYNSGKFPCSIVGASAGGKFDFQNTFIFDDSKVVQNSAVLALIEVKEKIAFGIFKTQNFKKTDHFFTVNESNSALRYVKTVTRQGSYEEENIIDYLCSVFVCLPEELNDKFKNYAFALDIEKSLYIRSVSSVDLDNQVLNFYIDVDYGDKLYLCEMTDIVEYTHNDFKNFMKDKLTKPVAGILNDCILRRVFNQDGLDNIRTFDDIPFIGFSTFGEFQGTNVNQTLTAIFFFEIQNGQTFHDKYLDNFIINYAKYQNFFKERKLKNTYRKMTSMNKELMSKIEEVEECKRIKLDKQRLEKLETIVNSINTPLTLAMKGVKQIKQDTTEIKYLFDDTELSDSDIDTYIQNNYFFSSSVIDNLEKVVDYTKDGGEIGL